MKYTVTETMFSDIFSNGEYLAEPTEHLSIRNKEEAEALFQKLSNDFIKANPEWKVLVKTASLFRATGSPFSWDDERKDIYDIIIKCFHKKPKSFSGLLKLFGYNCYYQKERWQ